MPQYTFTVNEVTQRVVNKKAGGTTTIYQILDEFGNKWETWSQPVAKEASRMTGQVVEIMGDIEQNGQYTNRKINDIRLATNSQQAGATMTPNPAERAMQAQPNGNQTPEPTIMRAGDEAPTQKDYRIGRQTAAKVSAVISGDDPQSFWSNLDTLVTYFITGLIPPQYNQVTGYSEQPRMEPVQEANQFIPAAAFADAAPWPGENPDSDIPFAPTMGPHGF